MTNEERFATIRNVISVLDAILDAAEAETGADEIPDDLWADAKLVAEYITEGTPHL